MSEKVTKNVIGMFILAILFAAMSSFATYAITKSVVGVREYNNGVEAGKGQVLEAVSGDAYELRLYGYKDGKVYEMEHSYGYSINGQPVVQLLPADARRGDAAICMKPGEALKIIAKQ